MLVNSWSHMASRPNDCPSQLAAAIIGFKLEQTSRQTPCQLWSLGYVLGSLASSMNYVRGMSSSLH